MKIVRIEREISNKVFIGGYETVSPSVRLVAEFDSRMEDPVEVATQLGRIVEDLWVCALQEDIELAMKRRTASGQVWSDDKLLGLVTAIPSLKGGQ